MASRPYLPPYPIFNASSMATSLTSTPTNISQLAYVSFDVAWTGTPTGTFSVEVSNSYSVDATGALKDAGNWTALTLSASVSAAGSASNAFIDIDGVAATWIRLKYTRSSGTGNLTAYISGKVS